MGYAADNKRIAKNTLMLFVRMLVLMVISLYTTRVVLDALGVSDYGVYNIAASVVSMFSIVSGSISAAISRFLTFELGRGDLEKLRQLFSASVTIQVLIFAVVLVLAETIGVWFLNCRLNIPDNRLFAANFVFQFSLFTFGFNLISAPYNASIVSHEHMSAFAYVSVVEAVGKLLVAFVLVMSSIDKLILYSFLLLVVSISIRFLYAYYCRRHFEECTFRFNFDKSVIKDLFSFAGWNFIGASSALLRSTGGNILLNLFFGTAVNAARGVSVQVNSAVSKFVHCFTISANPQITKVYAQGNIPEVNRLISFSTRISYSLLLFVTLPLLFYTSEVLALWLKEVPDESDLFVKLTLSFSLSECLSNSLVTTMLATGKIKNYQIVVGGLMLLCLPISYLFLRTGCQPYVVFVVPIVMSQICFFFRLIMLRHVVNSFSFIFGVYFRLLLLTVIVVGLSYYFCCCLGQNLFISVLAQEFICLPIIVFVATNTSERKSFVSYVKRRFLE